MCSVRIRRTRWRSAARRYYRSYGRKTTMDWLYCAAPDPYELGRRTALGYRTFLCRRRRSMGEEVPLAEQRQRFVERLAELDTLLAA